MRAELQGRRAGPGALHGHVFEMAAHQLADARAAVDMRDDLDQDVRRGQVPRFGRQVERTVLVLHGAGGDADGAVVQRADQRVGLDRQPRLRQLLGKSPQLAARRNRRIVVQEHLVGIAAGLSAVAYRNDLPDFRIVAETGRVRHADELVVHHRFDDLKQLRHHPAQRLGGGPVANDEVLPVDEAIRPRGEKRDRRAALRTLFCAGMPDP